MRGGHCSDSKGSLGCLLNSIELLIRELQLVPICDGLQKETWRFIEEPEDISPQDVSILEWKPESGSHNNRIYARPQGVPLR